MCAEGNFQLEEEWGRYNSQGNLFSLRWIRETRPSAFDRASKTKPGTVFRFSEMTRATGWHTPEVYELNLSKLVFAVVYYRLLFTKCGAVAEFFYFYPLGSSPLWNKTIFAIFCERIRSNKNNKMFMFNKSDQWPRSDGSSSVCRSGSTIQRSSPGSRLRDRFFLLPYLLILCKRMNKPKKTANTYTDDPFDSKANARLAKLDHEETTKNAKEIYKIKKRFEMYDHKFPKGAEYQKWIRDDFKSVEHYRRQGCVCYRLSGEHCQSCEAFQFWATFQYKLSFIDCRYPIEIRHNLEEYWHRHSKFRPYCIDNSPWLKIKARIEEEATPEFQVKFIADTKRAYLNLCNDGRLYNRWEHGERVNKDFRKIHKFYTTHKCTNPKKTRFQDTAYFFLIETAAFQMVRVLSVRHTYHMLVILTTELLVSFGQMRLWNKWRRTSTTMKENSPCVLIIRIGKRRRRDAATYRRHLLPTRSKHK